MRLTGAGILLYNVNQTHILLVKDSLSKKWSIPKGQYENFDDNLLITAIREVEEETGLMWFYDYIIDKRLGKSNNYLFYEGKVYSNTLRKISCLKENVELIEWAEISKLSEYSMNSATKHILKRISAKPHKNCPSHD